MKAHRHVYLDFPDFTQESCYEITSKVTFQNGVKDEIKTTIVCDEPEYVNLTDEEFDKAMEEKVEWLDWEKVILLKVSV